MYKGPLLTSVPSAVPSTGGVYLADLRLGSSQQAQSDIVRLRWPPQLQ